MGIYDYMNHFWFENENDPCSLSETSLFFYLLYEANRQHWVMPFKVSTQMLVARLNTSKQNVMKAKAEASLLFTHSIFRRYYRNRCPQ